MDVVTLTGLLYFTGGGSNPFLIFYFANLAIAGMILPRQLAWLVAFLSVAGVSWLLNEARSIDAIANSPLDPAAPWGVSKFAFLVAFATSSCVITYFVTMLAGELREREKQLAISEQEKERSRRLEAMATLAAGAGHELASPLSTIAVVAKELSRNLEKYEVSSGIRRDVDLIREELNRCREILHRMKSGAGEAAAEHLHPISLAELIHETVAAMREPQRVVIDLPEEIANKKGLLPKQALSQALRNLLQNGLDASPLHGHVTLSIRELTTGSRTTKWKLTITDHGTGLSEEVARRIGEPFFTTKEVGQGMGLGVFLTRNVIQGVGGTIKFGSPSEGGTICEVEIPTRTSVETGR
jgi:two-component system sensor histidine kinase RegB